VAIALVPPLAVVGLMISQTEWAAASGAMLLFTTNLVAILLMGGLVFILTGVVPVLQMVERRNYLRRSLGMVAILAIGVVAILGVSAETFQRQTAGLATASDVVAAWLSGTDLEVSSTSYQDGSYHVVVAGADEPPPIEDLANEMEDALGTPTAVEVTWVPTQTLAFDPEG